MQGGFLKLYKCLGQHAKKGVHSHKLILRREPGQVQFQIPSYYHTVLGSYWHGQVSKLIIYD